MSETPERIWFGVQDGAEGSIEGWSVSPEPEPDAEWTSVKEYINADAVRALIAERDEALNQLDSALHSVDVLERRVAEAERRGMERAVRILTDVGTYTAQSFADHIRAAMKGRDDD